MSRTARPRHRALGITAAILTAVLALTGCAAGQISQTADEVSAVDGASGTVGYLGVRNVLLATPEKLSYPKGSDASLLLWISNTSQQADTLASVSSTAAASVQITGTPQIGAQSLLEVGAKTPVTVTVKGLTRDLTFGNWIPVTFNFTSAGSVTVNVPMEIPVERQGDPRPTVNIQPEQPPNLWESSAPAGG